RGHKTGIQDPFISVLEGIISRGSSEVCSLIEQAWEKGCRLDAWTEYLKKDIWEEIIKSNIELIKNIMDPKPVETPVPWNFIKSGVSTQFLKKENERSQACEFTSACIKNCTQHCGACDNNNKIVENIIQDNVNSKGTAGKSETNNLIQVQANKPAIKRDPSLYRIIFSFSKEGKAIFDSHLDLMELFSMAFTRTNMPVLYSSGYNPLPVLEIVSPLALGISSDNEIAAVMADKPIDPAFFLAEMNKSLVSGITIRKAMTLLIPSGVKKHSLSSWLWGSIYENPESGMDYVKYPDEKKYRLERINSSSHKTYWGLKRLDVLAKDPANPENGKSFFEVFGSLYPNR
ncbi:MAG: TIGR03936 family radical SAM-associated protein, partial [Treponema sp.]|nr:TIGR03936 family radical SAM-associated protein [Treponema sp.]